jgi:hypothetical protein
VKTKSSIWRPWYNSVSEGLDTTQYLKALIQLSIWRPWYNSVSEGLDLKGGWQLFCWCWPLIPSSSKISRAQQLSSIMDSSAIIAFHFGPKPCVICHPYSVCVILILWVLSMILSNGLCDLVVPVMMWQCTVQLSTQLWPVASLLTRVITQSLCPVWSLSLCVIRPTISCVIRVTLWSVISSCENRKLWGNKFTLIMKPR